MIAATHPASAVRRSSLERIFQAIAALVSSARFAVAVIIAIAIACAVGTVLPQGMDAVAFVEKRPEAARLMDTGAMLGLTNVFSSWWFIGLLGVLATSVVACSCRRFAVLRRSGTARRRVVGTLLAHLSILLVLAGSVMRAVWGEKGVLELRTGETLGQFRMDRGSQPLPFALHLAKFEVESYQSTGSPSLIPPAVNGDRPDRGCEHLIVQWPARKLAASLPILLEHEQVLSAPNEPVTPENTFRIKIVKHVPDFVIDPQTRVVGTRSTEPRNPAILVTVVGPGFYNHQWVFAQFPDFNLHTAEARSSGVNPLRLVYERHTGERAAAASTGPIKSFRSEINVVEDGKVTLTATIEVNRPFTYKNYTFYQSGYNPAAPDWTSFQVVRDPGVPVVYAGFVLLLVGLFIVFYLNPWLDARSGAIRSAAPEGVIGLRIRT